MFSLEEQRGIEDLIFGRVTRFFFFSEHHIPVLQHHPDVFN